MFYYLSCEFCKKGVNALCITHQIIKEIICELASLFKQHIRHILCLFLISVSKFVDKLVSTFLKHKPEEIHTIK